MSYVETLGPEVHVLNVSNSVDSLMADEDGARAAASIKLRVLPHHLVALLIRSVGAEHLMSFCQAWVKLVNMFKSYLRQEEERPDWQKESKFLISEFLCKIIFITKAKLP